MSPDVKREKRDVSGWVVLDKPIGMTSTQAVGKVRWLYAARKAGHAGTLDPLATGILPIALGEATKTVPHVQDGTKTYRFAVTWGIATETADAEGGIVATSEVRPTEAAVRAMLPAFVGTIVQTPPTYSAIKIGGERAYDLARAGEAVALAPREVRIDALTLVAHTPDVSTFEVTCGKGTYVRALAVDLALALGTVGHVSMLRRTAVGPFREADATTLDAIEAAPDPRSLLRPVSAALSGYAEIRLDAAQVAVARNGGAVLLVGAGAPIAVEEAWASHAGLPVAIGSVVQGRFVPRRVLHALSA
jgi:tRNA pseudouridine55 synthase